MPDVCCGSVALKGEWPSLSGCAEQRKGKERKGKEGRGRDEEARNEDRGRMSL